MADLSYKERVSLVLEDLLFFSRYLVSGISKPVTALKPLGHLSLLEFLCRNMEHRLFWFRDQFLVSILTYTRLCLIIIYMIVNVPTLLDSV